ncbi:MAG: carboxypeptidase-like regulatory domain-containing protein [Gemmatimonadaceae bacterium]
MNSSNVNGPRGDTPVTGCLVSRRRQAMLALVAAIVWLPASVRAQQIHGLVTETGGAPVPGAVLTLLAEDGRRVATALTSEGGAYVVRAPRAGSYTLEIKRIGVRLTRIGPFTLADGDVREESVTLRPVPLLQPEVRIAGKSRCARQTEVNDATATLWENARAALAAVTLTQDAGSAQARITRITRDIEAASMRVTNERRAESYAFGSRPFASVPAETLATLGYVRRDGNGFIYNAPDARVILSDVFLADHCFRSAGPDKADTTVTGLRFEPVREKAMADVSGVMWIDRRTFELKSIEFVYENPPPPHERGQAGGAVHFRRIRAGWIVDKWYIRWPRFAGLSRQDPTSTAAVFGNRTAPGVMAYREEGGEAVMVGADEVATGRLSGVVVDGEAGSPVAGARVVVTQTGFTQARGVTAAVGTFRLDSIPAGRYTVTVSHPRLDSLGIRGRSSELEVRARDSLTVRLQIPSEAAAWRSLCPDEPDRGAHALVRVLATNDRSGALQEGVTLRLSWEGTGAAGVSATTDDDGSMTSCKLPVDRPVRVAAIVDGREVAAKSVTLAPGSLRVIPLSVPAPKR